jgi:hypothetical protein
LRSLRSLARPLRSLARVARSPASIARPLTAAAALCLVTVVPMINLPLCASLVQPLRTEYTVASAVSVWETSMICMWWLVLTTS